MKSLLTVIICHLAILSYGQVSLNPIPDQIIGRSGSFESVDLTSLTDEDVFWEVQFLPPHVQDVRPSWTVKSGYQFEMNVTAIVESKGQNAIGDSHKLAVVDDQGEVRSVGSAIQVAEDWVYFLTVYSNTNEEALKFRFFDDSIQQIIKDPTAIVFRSNSVIGEPDEPYVIKVANISTELMEGTLNFQIEDLDFTGTEKLQVTARSFDDPLDFDIQEFDLTVSSDYAPSIIGITDQVTNFGTDFDSFDLDDYTSLQDSDAVVFSFAGNTELLVEIDNQNVVSVSKPDGWSGSEDIVFTVTDQSDNAFHSSQTVRFTGKPQDQAPDIAVIGDRVTGIGGFFEPINLSQYLTASNPDQVVWDVAFVTDSAVANPNWSVNANQFQFNMSLTASVVSLGKQLSGTAHTLAAYSASENKIVGVTEAVEVDGEWFFFLTINGNTDQDSIYFEVFDANSSRILPTNGHVAFQANEIVGDPLEPFVIEAGYLFTALNGNLLSFRMRESDWVGTESVRITATDLGTSTHLSDNETIKFEVLDLRPPVISKISDQVIQEGSDLAPIDLNNYLQNASINDVSVEIYGADTLKPAFTDGIISFTIENDDYFGEEELEIKVTSLANSELFDVESLRLKITNVNDDPVITTSAPDAAAIDNLYYYQFNVADTDGDEINVSASGLPSWLFFVPSQSGAVILGIPTLHDAGEFSFTLSANDGQRMVSEQIDLIVSQAKIETIAKQTINEGENFDPIDLSNFLTLVGDLQVSWNISQSDELVIDLNEDILSIAPPHENWFGTETVLVSLINDEDQSLIDEAEIVLEVINVNDAPVFTSNPSGSYNNNDIVDVKTLVEDIDGDVLTFTLSGAPDWLRLFSEVDGFTIYGEPDDRSERHTFEVTADDGSTQTHMTIELDITLILDTTQPSVGFSVYPNPTSSFLHFEGASLSQDILLLDQQGKQVKAFSGGQKLLDVSDLSSGLYFLKMSDDQIIRFIKE